MKGLTTACLSLAITAATWQQSAQADENILSGTTPLEIEQPLDVYVMDQAHAVIDREIEQAVAQKSQHWQRDLSSADAYNDSIAPQRQRLIEILGVTQNASPVPTHLAFPPQTLEQRLTVLRDSPDRPLARTLSGVRIDRVEWPALPGVVGSGLCIEPRGRAIGTVIILPDADETPEEFCHLLRKENSTGSLDWPLQLATNGYRVLVMQLVDRGEVQAQPSARARQFDQSHREWIWRQAYHMGRHIIGYEVTKVIAAVNAAQGELGDSPVAVVGRGEGSYVALYAAAIDPRIDVTLISGDWDSRRPAWTEPIYRHIWDWSTMFDYADIASMIAPRKLIVELATDPPIDAVRDKAWPADMSPASDPSSQVTAAAEKLQPSSAGDPGAIWNQWHYVLQDRGSSISFHQESFDLLFQLVSEARNKAIRDFEQPTDLHIGIGTDRIAEASHNRRDRVRRELDEFTQELIRDSYAVRKAFFLDRVLPVLLDRTWSTRAFHPVTPAAQFTPQLAEYRETFATQLMGRIDKPLLPPRPQSRLLEQTDRWTAYEVVLDVSEGLSAWGVLMLPPDVPADAMDPAAEGIKPRPVVVLQHGRNGLPVNIVKGGYNGIAEKLLSRGYIVFAPHNIYRNEARYRWLDRKANAIGLTLFSVLIHQHDQITRWLASLPAVDGDRIAFYGNSYGGESAVRIPTVLTQYALSICASDFNDWTHKVAYAHDPHSFMATDEWEMPYFNLGMTFSYAEMAYLMIPRPFMVERGHHDLVAPDHWVASEFAKVREVYDQLGIGDRTEITFFQGGHTMRGEATVDFIERHLGPAR